jgi:zinc/manganese transport system permease protein
MSEILIFFAAPFAMCLTLVGIHCYLGLHVLKRGIIFIDLSLAQVACLGSTVALLFGIDHHSLGAYFVSLLFTFLASGLFAYGKKVENKISQEVLIGVVYALASAAVVLVVDSLAHGAEHLKELLIGRVLWVSWPDVFKTAAIYSVVGLIHFFVRKNMVALSEGKPIKNAAWWDFLFYGLFGVVITSSVNVAGILLVFSFLIVPALLSTFLYQSLKSRLIFGWVLGFFLCVLGMAISYFKDWPAGAVLVVCFTILPVLALPFLRFNR